MIWNSGYDQSLYGYMSDRNQKGTQQRFQQAIAHIYFKYLWVSGSTHLFKILKERKEDECWYLWLNKTAVFTMFSSE